MDNPARHRTVGLVGLGVIGRVHLDVLTADPRVTLAFVADPRAGTHPASAIWSATGTRERHMPQAARSMPMASHSR